MGKSKTQAAACARPAYRKLVSRAPASGNLEKASGRRSLSQDRHDIVADVAPQIEFLRFLSNELRKPRVSGAQGAVPMLQSMFDAWENPPSAQQEDSYRKPELGGVEAFWIRPANADSARIVLYVNSGGVDIGDSFGCRKVASNLAGVLRSEAVVVGCHCPSARPLSAQIRDALSAYKGLIDLGYAPQDITMAGDSLGAKVVLCCVLGMRAFNLPMPGNVIAMTPWLDAESEHDSRSPMQKGCLTLPSAIAYEQAPAVAAAQDILRASYRGFPRLYINVGAVDGFLDNLLLERAQKLHARAVKAGVDACLSVVDGMHHAFPFLARQAPAAEMELQHIAQWLADGKRSVAGAGLARAQLRSGVAQGAARRD
ncbi:Acetyl esterase/lipase [Solimonas aquatica]|uniref:Acetyl esterase/lipase n=2 Tax=Solimonas aquatica TaxID=489703 RepID=A0A1H9JC72_9GAMM|nr:Acetyl esterase/lipase [Solimonas aquatica]